MTVIDIIKKRYAAKMFTGEKIKSEDLKILKDSIRLAPSSFNWQPWKIKIVDDKEILKKLEAASWNQPQVGTASHLFVFCAINSLTNNNKKLKSSMKKFMPEEKFLGYEKIIDGALSHMDSESQKRMSERELFIPAENLSLVATDLGYASCHMGGFVADEYKKILDLPEDLTPVVVVPVGIAADSPREKFRFSEDEIFF